MSNKMLNTVEGEASESDDEAKGYQSQKYGISVNGEASESDDELNADHELFKISSNVQTIKHSVESPNPSGLLEEFESNQNYKILYYITEFKQVIWDNMKKLLENNLLESLNELRKADKILLKSQMTLQNVSYNLGVSSSNTTKLIQITDKLKTTQFLPDII